MHRLAPLLFLLLPACGMKGPLYEPAPPAAEAATTEAATTEAATTEPAPDDTDKGDRKTIPPTPDPAQSR
jgi:predicted small lipoprotein YifL